MYGTPLMRSSKHNGLVSEAWARSHDSVYVGWASRPPFLSSLEFNLSQTLALYFNYNLSNFTEDIYGAAEADVLYELASFFGLELNLERPLLG